MRDNRSFRPYANVRRGTMPDMTSRHKQRASRILLFGLVLASILIVPAVSANLVRVGAEQDHPRGLVLADQDRGGVTIRYGMESFGTERVSVQGRTMQTITLSGAMLPNNAGAPDLPGMGRFIAVPRGATPRLTIVSAQTQSFRGIDVAPAPVLPADDDPSPPIYEMDLTIYRRDAFYPESPAMLSPLTEIRGIDAVILGLTPFQYNPVTRELVVYTALEVRVDFEGGQGVFGDSRARSDAWEPILREHLVNYASLPASQPLRETVPGEAEYVILCPDHPDFIAWADTIKTWRTLQGIPTRVFTTAETGTSVAAIDSWFTSLYMTWDPRPAAFLILGDYVPEGSPLPGVVAPLYNNNCASDNIYADANGDHLPDFIHGRICARDSIELATMIGKMLEYERSPVTDSLFYARPVIAGGWQDERWFILCAEVIRGHQVNVLGKDPQREYAIYSGDPEALGYWSTNMNTPMVVDYFGSNGLAYIPDSLPPLTWDGSAERITAGLNAGAYMIFHRDHGGVTGWGEPGYHNVDLDNLTTEQHPFVFSMNCETGHYNGSLECFAERFHRLPNGALGLIAASETSFSFVNDVFAWGIFDGLWPDFDPGYGPAGEPHLRTATAHVSGKYYLEASSWPSNPYDKRITYHLFHHHGDAYMTLFTEVPESLAVVHDLVSFLDRTHFAVQADSGAVVALTVDGELIGRATADGSPQNIAIVPQTEPCTLRITATAPNHFRYDVSIPMIADVPTLVLTGVQLADEPAADSLAVMNGNGDGDADSGETLELVFTLSNAGTDPATTIQATLLTEDPYVELLDAVRPFGDLEPDSVFTCPDPYRIAIASNCPDAHEVQFGLLIESDQGSWQCPWTLPVHAPALSVDGFTVVDTTAGNGNGRADPGESFLFAPRLVNSGSEVATNLEIAMHIHHPLATVVAYRAIIDTLRCAEAVDLDQLFEVTIDSLAVTPDLYAGELVINADWERNAYPTFEIPVGWLFDDMEAGPGGWTSEPVTPEYLDQWHGTELRNHSPEGSRCWRFGDPEMGIYSDLADGALVSDSLLLNDDCELRFWHWIQAEIDTEHPGICNDGGIVEMSVDGGPWTQLVPVGNYPFVIGSNDSLCPFAEGTPVFSGEQDWQQVVIELNGYAGSQARFRFRFGSDSSDGLEGWYIDDVELVGRACDPSGTEEPPVPLTLTPALMHNQPNPFLRATVISYALPARTSVKLRIFDPAGRLVRTLLDGPSEPGLHTLTWDGRDDGGRVVSSGVYLYRLEADRVRDTRKMVLSR